MIAATSAAVKEEHQISNCMYCGTKFEKQWQRKISGGLERKVNKCENCGHEARIKVSKHIDSRQFFRMHSLDWGEKVKVKDY